MDTICRRTPQHVTMCFLKKQPLRPTTTIIIIMGHRSLVSVVTMGWETGGHPQGHCCWGVLLLQCSRPGGLRLAQPEIRFSFCNIACSVVWNSNLGGDLVCWQKWNLGVRMALPIFKYDLNNGSSKYIWNVAKISTWLQGSTNQKTSIFLLAALENWKFKNYFSCSSPLFTRLRSCVYIYIYMNYLENLGWAVLNIAINFWYDNFLTHQTVQVFVCSCKGESFESRNE